jgi:hypothetical protein
MPDSQMVDGATFSCASAYRRSSFAASCSRLALPRAIMASTIGWCANASIAGAAVGAGTGTGGKSRFRTAARAQPRASSCATGCGEPKMLWSGLSWSTPMATATRHQSTNGAHERSNEGRSMMCCARAQRARGNTGPLASKRNSSGTSGGGTMTPNRTVSRVAASSAATVSWLPDGVAAPTEHCPLPTLRRTPRQWHPSWPQNHRPRPSNQ